MFILEGVLEKVEKEKVEGMEMIACVDNVDFMVGGESVEVIRDSVRRMEVVLKRGGEMWKVDVQCNEGGGDVDGQEQESVRGGVEVVGSRYEDEVERKGFESVVGV